MFDTFRQLRYKKIIYYENTHYYLFLYRTESVDQMWITCIMYVCIIIM